MSTDPVSIVATAAATACATIGASIVVAVANDPVVVAGAIAAAIVLVLTGAGTMVVQIINARSVSKGLREAAAERILHLTISKSTSEVVKDTAKKADKIVGATEEIHALANSTNSNLQASLDVMAEKVAGQDRIIAELRAAKVDTAAAQALTDQRSALTTPVAGSPTGSTPVEMKIVNPESDPANVNQIAKP